LDEVPASAACVVADELALADEQPQTARSTDTARQIMTAMRPKGMELERDTLKDLPDE
jgi:hypothetical protein